MHERDRPEATRFARAFPLLATLAALLLAGCPASRLPRAGDGSITPGKHEITLRHGDRTRRAIVYVPRGASRASDLPLILAFHGGGGDAAGFRDYAGLDALAEREAFVVVYPYGSGALSRRLLTWNSGTHCCGYARDRDVDDVGFAIALLDHVARLTPIDARRVYAIGHSNGAMMAYRLAAERADRIVAIAAVAGALDLDTLTLTRPVPLLHVHSIDDPRALYAGGLGPPFPFTTHRVRHRPVVAGLSRWAHQNGCEDAVTVVERREGAAGTANERQSAARLMHVACPAGASVEHWRLSGSGHGWPGRRTEYPNAELMGPPTTLIDAAEEAWSFFRRFRG